MAPVNNNLWRAADAAEATNGTTSTDWRASGVSIDTRTLNQGDLFIALKGPNFDGHDYVSAAFERGAAAAMVSAAMPRLKAAGDGRPQLLVQDTFDGLNELGDAGRGRATAKIIAVTGSVGKTGVKEALAQLLGNQGATSYSIGSLNNHWGVPLSLARMGMDADYGVFELGMNHAGELRRLSQLVRPHVAVVTTVEPAHLEFFASVEDIARAKAEIFSGLESGGTAILNRDNPYFDILEAEAHACGVQTILGFGVHADADFRLLDFKLADDGSTVKAAFQGQTLDYRIPQPGRHWVQNSLAVLAATQAIGADIFDAAQAFAEVAPTKGRGQRHHIDTGEIEFLLIDDSYNASPVSIAAALQVLANCQPGPTGRRIAVLGDMLELGSGAIALHEALAVDIAALNIDVVYAAGIMMKRLFDILPVDQQGVAAEKTAALAPTLETDIRTGDVILVKGSAGSSTGLIVDHLKAMDRKGGAHAV